LTASITHYANPRQSACLTLQRIVRENSHADLMIDQELRNGALEGPDRGLYTELVFGVLRRQGTLDYLLAGLVTSPLNRLQPQILMILRLGLYQLIYLDRIPASAAVNESVKLAKQIVPKAAGLVNAVLRSYLRQKDTIALPDLASDPVRHIAVKHSQPEWLVQQWLHQLGATETERLAEAMSAHPPLTLRVNTICTSREDLLELFSSHNISASSCAFSRDGITLSGRHQISALPGFKEGFFTVQDEASQIAGLLLGSRPGETLLDVCAAPGGKSTHLAQLMQNSGRIDAADISSKKLALISENCDRLGIGIVQPLTCNLLKCDQPPEKFYDRILLDAPCSATGVIRRNPEAKWRLQPEDIKRLAATQARLLEQAAQLVKPGGVLLYSTCSTTLEENEMVVTEFISCHKEFVLDELNILFPEFQPLITRQGFFRGWPHLNEMDGFFAARLRRTQ